ncbi:7-cyano-7-deazaguanine synthase QueC [Methanospirillum purgamenti]|jgi:7-cyano-7-deazaguanine synthase|uniref:7-cyano-7-deazaguanine synthase n=1 Tax=Methanospirillum hungatei TaxID=2203 RepID=A0A8F5VQU7_METHU|nr:7-cyano-7-deazaguanine synthase QueC [Methanospirillum hungatei]QXO96247.1 7-cyano-7-deazaguanine synthase QueC [Methanospirillum hungatei]
MKAVCLLSGGMDSSTLAFLAKHDGYDILALHFTYGQRTEEKERECAKRIARHLNALEFLDVDLAYLKKVGASSLTDQRMQVKPHNEAGEGIPETYVPFRNANLLSVATSFAEARAADAIYIGVQASDYSGYPDCRPEFIDAFQKVITLGTRPDSGIELKTPFVRLNKAEILKIGMELNAPYEDTWSCYSENEIACGICGSCHFRREAFRQIGIEDPIQYR